MRRTIVLAVCAAMTVSGLTAAAATAAAAPATAAAPTPLARAAGAAAAFVSGRPGVLHPGAGDSYAAHPALTGGNGLQYVAYDRNYRNVPVLGGDFVVVTNMSGQVLSTSVGKQQQPLTLSVAPRLAANAAAATARSALPGGKVQRTTLVVDATQAAPRLAWESVVTGHHGAIPSRLHVVVDALSGAVLSQRDEVVEGGGTGAWNGPSPVAIQTTGSGTSFTMTDSTRPGISCRDFTSKAVLSGTDDLWGNGNATVKETGCVDALYSVQHEWSMLGSWLGRNGINGSGGGFPTYVGLNDQNAYWDGSSVNIGHNTAGQWISSQDVVGHEFGHAIDSNTPGGQSGNGVSEATGDIFGTSTEFWSNEATPFDTPDFTIGEQINLVGSGPIRNMANPGSVGDPNCYTSTIPTAETHAAAGPFDHWFFLASGGLAAPGGSQTSRCNTAVVAGGLGVKDTLRVFYNAMLSKTAGMTYLKYRTATLNAAKNLFPGNCAPFGTVKAAWDAVTVPAQAADPTCTATGGAVSVTNPGSKTGTVGAPIAPFTMTASGGTGTYTWSASGLPAGISINSATGVVSGTPTLAGSNTTTVTATSGTSGSTSFSFVISPAGTGCAAPGQQVLNPGFESGSASWTGTAGVIGQNGPQEPAHTGTWDAWLNGYGTTHTDSLSQSVTVPANCRTVTLSFSLHIDTAETTTTTAFDKLAVQFGTTTAASFSNLNKAAGYQLRTVALPAGSTTAQSFSLKFTGTEDSSLQTSFVVDDVTVNVGN